MRKLVVVLALAISAFGQVKPELTAEQKLSLENAQLKLKLAYMTLQQGQNEFQQKMKDFDAACQVIAKDHKLAAGTRCNPDNLEFVAPAKVETKK